MNGNKAIHIAVWLYEKIYQKIVTKYETNQQNKIRDTMPELPAEELGYHTVSQFTPLGLLDFAVLAFSRCCLNCCTYRQRGEIFHHIPHYPD